MCNCAICTQDSECQCGQAIVNSSQWVVHKYTQDMGMSCSLPSTQERNETDQNKVDLLQVKGWKGGIQISHHVTEMVAQS